MRVISGTARGRHAARGRSTRPTADLIKGAIFSMLEALAYKRGFEPDEDGNLAAALAWPRVLDLFAGSGGLGIEALSRGAQSAEFVEQDRAAARIIAGQSAQHRPGRARAGPPGAGRCGATERARPGGPGVCRSAVRGRAALAGDVEGAGQAWAAAADQRRGARAVRRRPSRRPAVGELPLRTVVGTGARGISLYACRRLTCADATLAIRYRHCRGHPVSARPARGSARRGLAPAADVAHARRRAGDPGHPRPDPRVHSRTSSRPPGA